MGGKMKSDPQANDDEDAATNAISEAREKDLVESYIQEHALEESLNEVINKVVVGRPADPFIVLSSLLYGKATAKRGIFHVECKEILDASGLPGILVRVHTGKGVFEASCSSAVVGKPDRPESFDEFAPTIPLDKQRYGGKGYKRRVQQAQALLIEALVDLEPKDQQAVDSALLLIEHDVGRNLCLAASVAVCKAGARYAELPLHEHIASLNELPLENVCSPMPLFSVVNGGKLASNKLFVQEIFVAPVSATSFADALQLGAELNRSVKNQLEERGVGFSNTGAFGGFAPQLQTVAETFQILRAAVEETRMRIENGGGPASLLLDNASVTPLRFEFGIDFAASEFVTPPPPPPPSGFTDGEDDAPQQEARTVFTYNTDQWVTGSSGAIRSSDEMHEVIQSLVRELDVTTVVDPFDRGDIKAFAAFMSSEHDANDAPEGSGDAGFQRRFVGGDPNCRLQIVARDLVDCHGLEAIQEERAANTVLLQLDHFPTVSRFLQAVTDARRYGLAIVLGASVGQSGMEASFLGALAVGTGTGQVKFGGLATGECVDRYNQLLLLSEDVVPPAFVGGSYRR